MIEKKIETPEKAVLVGLACPMLGEESSTEESLEELEELLKTAGGECLGRVLQNRKTPDPGSFIGEGKAEEIRAFVEGNQVNLAVFDNSLSPSQNRSLEKLLGCRVIDRSALILDIFASRARTREGKLQVELAQYQYMLPRLSGMWGHLVRQTASGGKSPIGTRGPGETQLETDRRHIRAKIARLKEELEDVRKNRATQRRKREKEAVPLAAIVGYTNAGKSTLLNALTGADIPALNRLFDTLDPTTRLLKLPDGKEMLVSDTVGFIRKLPHDLVSAFKATLEELSFADIILHVVDAANPQWPEQAEVTERLIEQLCPSDVPRIRVYNKADLCGVGELPVGEDVVWISALTGEGLDRLLSLMAKLLQRGRHEATLLFPYGEGALVNTLYQESNVKEINYTDEGVEVSLVCDSMTLARYLPYLKDRGETGDGSEL